MATTSIFRIDHHGSLIRPPGLVAAREAFRAGTLSAEALREAEDAAIRASVVDQRQLRLTVVSDGQFRRSDFRDAVFDGVVGFERTTRTDADGLRVWENTGEVRASGRLVVDDARFTAELTGIPTKATLPSPAYLAARTWVPGGPYASAAELGGVLAALVRDEIQALADAGLDYVQLDNPDYALHYTEIGPRPPAGLELLDALAIDAAAVEGLVKPEAFRVGICVDRGDVETDSADEQAAWEVFGSLPYDRFLLPYSSDVFAEQHLLQFVPDDVDVCLGIVDTAPGPLEPVDAILTRLDRAFELHHFDRVALSPTRGFQDADYLPPTLTVAEQDRRLTHVETIARMAYGGEL